MSFLEKFITETLGLTKFPPFLSTFYWAFVVFLFIHQVLAPYFSERLFPTVYGGKSRRAKNNWCVPFHLVIPRVPYTYIWSFYDGTGQYTSSHKSMFSLSFHMPSGASLMKPQSMGRTALLGGTSMSDTSMPLLVGQLILNSTHIPSFSDFGQFEATSSGIRWMP